MLRSRWLVVFTVVVLIGALLAVSGCSQTQQPAQKPTEEQKPQEPAQPAPKPADDKWPNRPISIVVPWPPGGRTDTATRALAPAIEKDLGSPVVVVNREGGGGVVGARFVADSQPDGYTVGIFSISLNLAKYTKAPPFEPEKYAPVGQAFSVPITVAVNAKSPWKTLDEFLKYAKDNPGKVKQGLSGSGTSEHVLSASLYQKAGVKITTIPYTGDAPAVNALVSGEVDTVSVPVSALKAQIEAKNVRVLGVSTAERHKLYPDIPTFKEGGIDFVADSFEGIYAPKATPQAIIDKFGAALKKALEDPEVIKRMEALALDPLYVPAAEFKAKIDKWDPEFSKLTGELGLKISNK